MNVEHLSTFVFALMHRSYYESYQQIQQTVSVESAAAAPQAFDQAWEAAQ